VNRHANKILSGIGQREQQPLKSELSRPHATNMADEQPGDEPPAYSVQSDVEITVSFVITLDASREDVASHYGFVFLGVYDPDLDRGVLRV
jgi:hypothetical protein